jgi:hypothetical protein
MEPAYEQHDFRYKFDKQFSPFLNRANWKYKLADFAHTTFNLTFKLERELLEEFDCGDLIPYQTKKNSQINMEYVRHLEMLNYKLVHDLYELRGDFIMT